MPATKSPQLLKSYNKPGRVHQDCMLIASSQSKRRFKIGLVFMPLADIRPPLSMTSLPISVDLIMDELGRRLARSHDVIAYCAHGKGQRKVEQFHGVEYRRMSTWLDRRLLNRRKFRRMIDLFRPRNAPQPMINHPMWYRRFIGKVSADLLRQDLDIVHIMNISQFVPVIRKRLSKTRIVLHMECQWLEHLDQTLIEPRITAADLMLGCSNFIAQGVRQRFPLLTERCSYIYNGVDTALFARPSGVRPKPKQLLYVGRLAPEKGIHILLDAFRIVLTQHPDAHLELIGPEVIIPRENLLPVCNDVHAQELEPYFRPGVYANLLRTKIAELPSNSVSLFSKGMIFNELVPHYHAASIFVFPSVWEEPFGMPVVEAMASRTPVVATLGGAFPEIVEHGWSGLLVARSDPHALAEAILQLLASPDRREAMAAAAFERASAMFSWDRIAQDLIGKYERLLGS
jgi:glycosyltransferase involved in cell wall biosynthesis